MENGLHVKKTFPTASDLLALLGVFIAATVLCGIVFGLLVRAGSLSEGLSVFLSYSIQFVVTICYALAVRRLRSGRGAKALSFGFRGVSPTIVLWGLLATFATTIVVEPLVDALPAGWLETLERQMELGGWVIVTTVVMAPLCEEILFRGILQDALTAKYGPLRGILTAAAVFGAIHLIPQQVVNAFFVGIVLGYIYYRTRSLVPVILIHALNNAVSYLQWTLCGRELTSTREMVGSDRTYWIIYGAACVVFVLSFVSMAFAIGREQKRRTPQQEDRTGEHVPEQESLSAREDNISGD